MMPKCLIKLSTSLCIILFSTTGWAFDCYFTLVKDSCWTKYDVTVDVTDANTLKPILTVNIPAGESWVREKFACKPLQKMAYKAHFSPEIWQGDANKTFSGQKFWELPDAIQSYQKAWNVEICYPKQFLSVPFPPDATGNCTCDFSKVTPLKL